MRTAAHLEAVARLHGLDQVIVADEEDGVRGLARGHHVGRLLQLDHLLVKELAPAGYHIGPPR